MNLGPDVGLTEIFIKIWRTKAKTIPVKPMPKIDAMIGKEKR